MSNQITTVGSNYRQDAFYSVNSKQVYDCANAYITRGSTGIPSSLDACLNSFPGIKDIATAIGFYTDPAGISGGISSGFKGYTLWTGSASKPDMNVFKPYDMYFTNPDTECDSIQSRFPDGDEWLGCLWGTPEAPYSCTCPDVQPKYEAYIKLRLNVASFWNTPVETPVKRAEFADALQYGRKIDVTVAGDFNLKLGQVVRLRLDGISGYPYSKTSNYLNDVYYITGIKHVFTSSGTHETALALSKIAGDYTGIANAPYYP